MAVIASIDGRDWVLGMEWSSYTSVPKRAELIGEAGEDESGEMETPWYSLRVTDEAIQAGFCAPVGDVVRPKKLASLAAMLADAEQQPWLGVFEIQPDLYWYIAVRDHYAILPGGDVVGTEEEIRRARAEHAGFGGWTFVEGDLAKLTELIGEVKAKRTPVHSLSVSRIDPVPTAIAVAVAALLVVGIGFGQHAYKHHKLQLARLELQRRMAHAPKEYIPTASDFLAKSPAPSDWLDACHRALSGMTLSDKGWRVTATACDSNTLSVHWVRGPGATVEATPPGVVVDLAGENGTQSIALSRPGRMGQDNSVDVRTATLAMIAWGQRYDSKVVVGSPMPLSQKAPVGWQIPVTIPMPVSPFEPGNGLDSIPGLRLTGLGPNAGQAGSQSTSGDQGAHGAWALTGVLYARQ